MNIDIQKLCLSIDSKTILSEIDLSVKKGEFVGVIGPNGSGKSTLLKCIYRVLKPNSGVIFLNERELKEYPVKETAKKMSVVAQNTMQSFDFTVLDMVLMGRSPYKKFLEGENANDIEIAKQALTEVGLQEFQNRSFLTLSGGEQQRVLLARALAQDTPCLILDEPTNHLDIRYQLHLLNVVKNSSHTVVAALHDLNLAVRFCDKLFLLDEGKVVAVGTPQEVLTSQQVKRVYGIDIQLYQDKNGKLHILYE